MKQIYIEKITGIRSRICQHRNALSQNNQIVPKKQGSYFNIFLDQNIGKGPPGIMPGQEAECLSGLANTSYNELKISIINKPNLFHTILNFLIMKKQILFLALFVLAMFANTSKSYSQCTPTALTPAVGIEYNYAATISGTGYDGSGGSEFDWYVTQNVDVILAADILDVSDGFFTVNASTPYHNGTTGVDNISLTWTATALASADPFYLVLRYKETNATATPACASENIRVWQIKPINTFLLALEGGMLSGTNYAPTAGSFTCAADVEGAVVTPGTPGTVLLTYGENTLYYVATASGIEGDWRPAIQLPDLESTQTYVSAEWTSDMTGAAGWVDFGAATNGNTQDLVSPSDATITDVAGTPILIRIVIDNVNWQTLADQPIELSLDGTLPPSYADPAGDIIGGSGSDACDIATAWARKATFNIKARPTIGGTPQFLLNTNP